MKLQDWIQIAMVIATLLLAAATVAGPMLAVRMSRKDQNTSTPSQRRRERWSRRFFKSPWVQSPWRLPAPLAMTYLFFLFKDLHSTAALTRGAVFDIAINVAGVLWVYMSVLSAMIGSELLSREDVDRSLWEAVRKILDIQLSMAETDQRLFNALESTARIEAVQDIQNSLTVMKEEIESVKQKSERRKR